MTNRSFDHGRDGNGATLAMAAVRAMSTSVSPDQVTLIMGMAEDVEIDAEVDGRGVVVAENGTFAAVAAAFVEFGSTGAGMLSDEVILDVRGRIVDGQAVIDGYVARLEPFL